MPNPFISAINMVGRFIEVILTGQSDFSVTTSEFRTADTIDNTVQAKLAFKEVSAYLHRNFAIDLQHPVIITLEKPHTRGWKRVIASAGSHVGCYSTRWLGEKLSHEVMVIPGMERRKFKAVLAHEIAHAYQAERKLLHTHRSLREGMSRWVEYHVLCALGLKNEAKKLCSYSSFILGRGIVTILEYERVHGRQATLDWLHNLG